jgi:hypothetical protein
VDDQLGPAADRGVGRGVEVADHQVGPVAGLEEGIGAAIDADEHGPHLADVGTQRGQVVSVGHAPDHHEDVTPGDLGPQVGQLGRVGE